MRPLKGAYHVKLVFLVFVVVIEFVYEYVGRKRLANNYNFMSKNLSRDFRLHYS
jgi:hypothetical protein